MSQGVSDSRNDSPSRYQSKYKDQISSVLKRVSDETSALEGEIGRLKGALKTPDNRDRMSDTYTPRTNVSEQAPIAAMLARRRTGSTSPQRSSPVRRELSSAYDEQKWATLRREVEGLQKSYLDDVSSRKHMEQDVGYLKRMVKEEQATTLSSLAGQIREVMDDREVRNRRIEAVQRHNEDNVLRLNGVMEGIRSDLKIVQTSVDGAKSDAKEARRAVATVETIAKEIPEIRVAQEEAYSYHRAEQKRLYEEVSSLQTQLKLERDDRTQMAKDMESLQSTMESLRRDLFTQADTIARTERRTIDVEATLSNTADVFGEALTRLEQKDAMCTRRVEVLEEARNSLTESTSKMEQQIATQTQTLAGLDGAMQSVRSEMNEIHGSVLNQSGRLDRLENAKDSLREETNRLNSANTSNIERLASLEHAWSEQVKAHKALSLELEEISRKTDSRLAGLDGSRQLLMEEVARLSKEGTDMDDAISGLRGSVKGLEDRVGNNYRELTTSLDHHTAAIQSDITKVDQSLCNLRATVETLDRDHSRLAGDYRGQIKTILDDLASKAEMITTLQASTGTNAVNIDAEKTNRTRADESLNEELKNVIGRVGALYDIVRDNDNSVIRNVAVIDENLATLNKASQKIEVRLGTVENQIHDTCKVVATHTSELKVHDESLNGCNREIQSVKDGLDTFETKNRLEMLEKAEAIEATKAGLARTTDLAAQVEKDHRAFFEISSVQQKEVSDLIRHIQDDLARFDVDFRRIEDTTSKHIASTDELAVRVTSSEANVADLKNGLASATEAFREGARVHDVAISDLQKMLDHHKDLLVQNEVTSNSRYDNLLHTLNGVSRTQEEMIEENKASFEEVYNKVTECFGDISRTASRLDSEVASLRSADTKQCETTDLLSAHVATTAADINSRIDRENEAIRSSAQSLQQQTDASFTDVRAAHERLAKSVAVLDEREVCAHKEAIKMAVTIEDNSNRMIDLLRDDASKLRRDFDQETADLRARADSAVANLDALKAQTKTDIDAHHIRIQANTAEAEKQAADLVSVGDGLAKAQREGIDRLSREYSALSHAVKAIDSSVNSLAESHDSSVKRHDAAIAENRILHDGLASDFKKMTSDNLDMHARSQDLCRQSSEKLRKDLSSVEADYKADIASLRVDIAGVNERSENNYERLVRRADDNTGAITSCRAEFATNVEDIKRSMYEAAEKQRIDHDAALRENKATLTRLGELSDEVASHYSDLSKADGRITAEIREVSDNAVKEIARVGDRVTSLADDVNASVANLTAADLKNTSALQSAVDLVKEDLVTYSARSDKVVEELLKADDRITAALKDGLSKHEHSLSDIRSSIGDLRVDLEKRVADLRLAGEKTEISLRDTSAALTREIERTNVDLASANASHDKTSMEMIQAHERLSNSHSDLSDRLASQISEIKILHTEMKSSLQQANDSAANMYSELLRADQSIKDAQAKESDRLDRAVSAARQASATVESHNQLASRVTTAEKVLGELESYTHERVASLEDLAVKHAATHASLEKEDLDLSERIKEAVASLRFETDSLLTKWKELGLSLDKNVSSLTAMVEKGARQDLDRHDEVTARLNDANKAHAKLVDEHNTAIERISRSQRELTDRLSRDEEASAAATKALREEQDKQAADFVRVDERLAQSQRSGIEKLVRDIATVESTVASVDLEVKRLGGESEKHATLLASNEVRAAQLDADLRRLHESGVITAAKVDGVLSDKLPGMDLRVTGLERDLGKTNDSQAELDRRLTRADTDIMRSLSDSTTQIREEVAGEITKVCTSLDRHTSQQSQVNDQVAGSIKTVEGTLDRHGAAIKGNEDATLAVQRDHSSAISDSASQIKSLLSKHTALAEDTKAAHSRLEVSIRETGAEACDRSDALRRDITALEDSSSKTNSEHSRRMSEMKASIEDVDGGVRKLTELVHARGQSTDASIESCNAQLERHDERLNAVGRELTAKDAALHEALRTESERITALAGGRHTPAGVSVASLMDKSVDLGRQLATAHKNQEATSRSVKELLDAHEVHVQGTRAAEVKLTDQLFEKEMSLKNLTGRVDTLANDLAHNTERTKELGRVMQAEADATSARFKNVDGDIASHSDTLHSLTDQIRELPRVRQDLTKSDADIARHDTLIKTLTSSVEKQEAALHRNADASRDGLERANTEIERAKTRTVAVEDNIGALTELVHKNIKRLEAEDARLSGDLKTAELSLQHAQKEANRDSTAEIHKLHQLYNDVNAEAGRINVAVKNVEAKCDDNKASAAQKEAAMREHFSQDLTEIRSNVERGNASTAMVQSELSAATRRFEKEYETLSLTQQNFEKSIEKFAIMVAEMNQEKTATQAKEMEKMREVFTDHDKEIEKTAVTLGTLSEQMKEIVVLQQKVQRLETDVGGTKTGLANAVDKVEKAKYEAAQSESAIKSQLSEKELAIKSLKSKMTAAETALDKVSAEVQEALRMQHNIQWLEREAGHAEAGIKDLSERVTRECNRWKESEEELNKANLDNSIAIKALAGRADAHEGGQRAVEASLAEHRESVDMVNTTTRATLLAVESTLKEHGETLNYHDSVVRGMDGEQKAHGGFDTRILGLEDGHKTMAREIMNIADRVDGELDSRGHQNQRLLENVQSLQDSVAIKDGLIKQFREGAHAEEQLWKENTQLNAEVEKQRELLARAKNELVKKDRDSAYAVEVRTLEEKFQAIRDAATARLYRSSPSPSPGLGPVQPGGTGGSALNIGASSAVGPSASMSSLGGIRATAGYQTPPPPMSAEERERMVNNATMLRSPQSYVSLLRSSETAPRERTEAKPAEQNETKGGDRAASQSPPADLESLAYS